MKPKSKLSRLNNFWIVGFAFLFPLVICIVSLCYLNKQGFCPFSINSIFTALKTLGGKIFLQFVFTCLSFMFLLFVGIGFYPLLVKDEARVSSWFLGAFVLAAIYSLVLLFTLGPLRIYFCWLIWTVTIIILWLFRKNILKFAQLCLKVWKNHKFESKKDLGLLLFLSALVFGGITLFTLQLVSPVTPFMDVLAVNSAPVQQVTAFSQYNPFSNTPSARFAANRSFPAYTAFFSYLTVTTGRTAVTTITSFMLIAFVILICSVYFLADRLSNSFLGGIAAWLFFLSFNYLHSQDVRSTVFAFIYVLLSHAFYITAVSKQQKCSGYTILSGLSAGVAVCTHILIGTVGLMAMLILFSVNLVLQRPLSAMKTLQILFVGLLISCFWIFPTLHTFGISPAIDALLILLIITGCIIAILFLEKKFLKKLLGKSKKGHVWILIFYLIPAFCNLNFFGFHGNYITNLGRAYPSITILYFVGLMLLILEFFVKHPEKTKNDIPNLLNIQLIYSLSILTAPALMISCLNFLPNKVFFKALAYEAYWKLEFYWASMLFIFAAGAVFVFMFNTVKGRFQKLWQMLTIMILFLITIAPLHSLDSITTNNYEEHKLSETQAIHLYYAANGYWKNFHDSRYLIDETQRKFVRFLNDLIKKGEIKINDTIIHLTDAPYNEVSTPFPVFTGIQQTFVTSKDYSNDLYTLGSRTYYYHDFFKSKNDLKWVLIQKPSAFENKFLTKVHSVVFEDKYHLLLKAK